MFKIGAAAALSAFVAYGSPLALDLSTQTGPEGQPHAVKGDRLPLRPTGGCADAWPYYRGHCVRRPEPSIQSPDVRQVRIVSADRLTITR